MDRIKKDISWWSPRWLMFKLKSLWVLLVEMMILLLILVIWLLILATIISKWEQQKKKKDSFYKRIGSIGLTLKKLYTTLKSYICSRTNKTRNLVPQPEDYNIFGYRSIFNAKGDENGSVRRFKVRLTEQGWYGELLACLNTFVTSYALRIFKGLLNMVSPSLRIVHIIHRIFSWVDHLHTNSCRKHILCVVYFPITSPTVPTSYPLLVNKFLAKRLLRLQTFPCNFPCRWPQKLMTYTFLHFYHVRRHVNYTLYEY